MFRLTRPALLLILALSAQQAAAQGKNGLKAKYFNHGPDTGGSTYLASAMISKDPPAPSWVDTAKIRSVTKTIASVDAALSDPVLASGDFKFYSEFSFRLEGFLQVTADAATSVKFFLDSNDGAILFIDDQKVIDVDGQRATDGTEILGGGSTSGEATAALTKGFYKFKLVYFQYAHSKVLDLKWDGGTGGALVAIPGTNLWEELPGCPKGRYDPNSGAAATLTCNLCDEGRYQDEVLAEGATALQGCKACPAGRYGDTQGLEKEQCTEACAKGHFCVAGSTTATAAKCPAGQYGDVTGLQSATCSGQCEPGYFCVEGSICKFGQTSGACDPNVGAAKCPAGRFSNGQAKDNTCTGPCAPGHFCKEGSADFYQYRCADNPALPANQPRVLISNPRSVFCTAGSTFPTQARDGFFTEGVTAETADRERECPENAFCKDGVFQLCPKGKFGNQKGNSDPKCSGDCLAGFNCPEGSNVNNKEACAPIGDPNPRKYYCPVGVGRLEAKNSNKPTEPGQYTIPEVGSEFNREGALNCEANSICTNGDRQKNLRWNPASSTSANCALIPAQAVTATVAENGSLAQVTGLKFEAVVATGTVKYSIKSVSPAAAFVIDAASGQVSAPANLDFEDNALVATNQKYTIVVEAEETSSKEIITCAGEVTVTDVNEAPTVEPNQVFFIEEGSSKGALVGGGDVRAVDPDNKHVTDKQELTWETVGGTDFKISKCAGSLFVEDATLDFEATPEYNITVKVTDNGLPSPRSGTGIVTIKVRNKNDAPTFNNAPTLTIKEDALDGTIVADMTDPTGVGAKDPDGDVLQFFKTRADNPDAFNLVGTTKDLQLTLASAGIASLDFETKNKYEIDIQAKDPGALTATQKITINVQNANDAPVVVFDSPGPTATSKQFVTVPEDQGAGVVPGFQLKATDQDDLAASTGALNEWKLSASGGKWSDSSANDFYEISATGQLRVKKALDFEGLPGAVDQVLKVRVADEDNKQSAEVDVTIKLQDVNESPTISPQTITIAENAEPTVARSAAVVATDPDQGQFLRYSIKGADPSGGKVSIDSATGEFVVLQKLDFESEKQYEFQIEVTDSASSPLTADAKVTLKVEDVPEPPTCNDVTVTVPENTGKAYTPQFYFSGNVGSPTTTWTRTLVGNAPLPEGSDQDAGSVLTYAINAHPRFELETGSRNLVVKDNTRLDFDADTKTFELDMTVTDNTLLTGKCKVTVQVEDVNEAPVLQVPAGTELGPALYVGQISERVDITLGEFSVFASDEDAGNRTALTYTLVNAGTSPFTLDPNSGQLSLKKEDQDKMCPNKPTGSCPVQLNVEVTASDGVHASTQVTVPVKIREVTSNLPPKVNAGCFPLTAVPECISADGNLPVKCATRRVKDFLAATDTNACFKDDEALTYELVGTTAFVIVGTELQIADGQDSRLNFEGSWQTDPDFTFKIIARDGLNQTAEQDVTVKVSNRPEFPSMQIASGCSEAACNDPKNAGSCCRGQPSVCTVDEGSTLAVACNISVSDEDVGSASPTVTLEPVTATSTPALFKPTQVSASGSSATWTMSATNALNVDFEASGSPMKDYCEAAGVGSRKRVCKFKLKATDAEGNVNKQLVDIVVNDVNEVPSFGTIPTLSANEHSTAINGDNTGIVLSTQDPDTPGTSFSTLRCSIVPGKDGAIFAVTEEDCLLSLKQAVDFEKKGVVKVDVQLADNAGQSPFLKVTEEITVTINNINDMKINSANNDQALQTAGGDVVQLTGTNLFRRYGSDPVISATYGPLGSVDEFTATDCTKGSGAPTITANAENQADDQFIECKAGPGQGQDLVWNVTVDGFSALSGKFVRSQYTGPNITAVAFDGTGDMVVTGTNFGPKIPTNALVSYRWVSQPQGSAFSPRGVNTGKCEITTAFTELTCKPLDGAGKGLVFTATVNGRSSAEHTQNDARHSQPVISDVNGGTAEGLKTQGGDTLIVQGQHFGPAQDATLLPQVRYGPKSAPKSQWFDAQDCKVVSATQMSCTAAPGAGQELSFIASIGGQESDEFSQTKLKYEKPQIASVSTLTGDAIATVGGDVVEILGQNFGIRGLVAQASYGKPTTLEFSAANCEVRSSTKIQCVTAPGSGKDHSWQVTLGGQASQVLGSQTSYAKPIVLKLSGQVVSEGGSTQGGQKVTITGENFGPLKGQPGGTDGKDNNLRAFYGPTQTCTELDPTCGITTDPYEYSTGDSCEVTIAHTQIVCSTTVGAGANHRWSVVVNGLLSTSPQSRYKPPTISSFSTSGSAPATTELSTNGADVVTITGIDFGDGSNKPNCKVGCTDQKYLGEVTYGPTGNERLYNAVNCKILTDHTAITCETVRGIGKDLAWQVDVRGQKSPVSTATTSYADPKITAVTPANAPTSGGTVVLVEGTNFGHAPKLTFDGVAQQVKAGSVLTGGKHSVSFEVPKKTAAQQAKGVNIPVVVSYVDQGASPPLTTPSAAFGFTFDDPIINNIEQPTSSTIEIFGINFGPKSPHAKLRFFQNISGDWENSNTIGQYIAASDILVWEDEFIKANVPILTGVGGRDPEGAIRVELGAARANRQYSCEAQTLNSTFFASNIPQGPLRTPGTCYPRVYSSKTPRILPQNYNTTETATNGEPKRLTASQCLTNRRAGSTACGVKRKKDCTVGCALACPCTFVSVQNASKDVRDNAIPNRECSSVGCEALRTSDVENFYPTFTTGDGGGASTSGGDVLTLHGVNFGSTDSNNEFRIRVDSNGKPKLPQVFVGKRGAQNGDDKSCGRSACAAPCDLEPFFDRAFFNLNSAGAKNVSSGKGWPRTIVDQNAKVITEIKCILPPGQGIMDVWVQNEDAKLSDAVPIHYRVPRVQWSVSDPAPVANKFEAATDGSTQVTLFGKYFGFSPQTIISPAQQAGTQQVGSAVRDQAKPSCGEDATRYQVCVNKDTSPGKCTAPPVGGGPQFIYTETQCSNAEAQLSPGDYRVKIHLPPGSGTQTIALQALGNPAEESSARKSFSTFTVDYLPPVVTGTGIDANYAKFTIFGRNFGHDDFSKDTKVTVSASGKELATESCSALLSVDHSEVSVNVDNKCNVKAILENKENKYNQTSIKYEVDGKSGSIDGPRLDKINIYNSDSPGKTSAPTDGKLTTDGKTYLIFEGENFFSERNNGTNIEVFMTAFVRDALDTTCEVIGRDDSICGDVGPASRCLAEYPSGSDREECFRALGMANSLSCPAGDSNCEAWNKRCWQDTRKCVKGVSINGREVTSNQGCPNDKDQFVCVIKDGTTGEGVVRATVQSGALTSNAIELSYQRPVIEWNTIAECKYDANTKVCTAVTNSTANIESVPLDGATFNVTGDQLGSRTNAKLVIACAQGKQDGVYAINSGNQRANLCTAKIEEIGGNFVIFTVAPGEGRGEIDYVVGNDGLQSKQAFSFARPIITNVTPKSIATTNPNKGSTANLNAADLITITGSNFGVSAEGNTAPEQDERATPPGASREHVVLIGSFREDPGVTQGGYPCVFDESVALTYWSASEIVCRVPEGAGQNLSVRVLATGVEGRKSNSFDYPLASVSGTAGNGQNAKYITGLEAGTAGTSDDYIVVTGSNLGIDGEFFLDGKPFVAPESNKGRVWNHTRIEYRAPEDAAGSSRGGNLVLYPGGKAHSAPIDLGVFRYANPEVRNVLEPASADKGTTAGGQLVTITGTSFGTNKTNIRVQFGAEGKPTEPLSVEHTKITLLTPPGIGKNVHVIVNRTVALRDNSAHACDRTNSSDSCYSYAAPEITRVEAQSPGRVIKIFGKNFAPNPPAGSGSASDLSATIVGGLLCGNAKYEYLTKNGVPVSTPHIECTPAPLAADAIVSRTVLDTSTGVPVITCYKAKNFSNAQESAWPEAGEQCTCTCENPIDPVTGECGAQDYAQACGFEIQAKVGNQLGESRSFRFQVPNLENVGPPEIDANGFPNLRLSGEQFGSDALPCPAEGEGRVVIRENCSSSEVLPNGLCPISSCPPPVRITFRGQNGTVKECQAPDANQGVWFKGDQRSLLRPFVQCQTQPDVVGPKEIAIAINNLQYVWSEENQLVNFKCESGFYGRIGELCRPCPLGAKCNGYVSNSQAHEDPHSREGFWQTQVQSCVQPENKDTPLCVRNTEAGKTSEAVDCGALDAVCSISEPDCAGSLSSPPRAQCLKFIPCEPPEACTGGSKCGLCNDLSSPVFANSTASCTKSLTDPASPNFGKTFEEACGTTKAIFDMCFDEHCCSERYTGERCALCAEGYYRLGGACEPCPDCPVCVVIVFIFVFIGALICGWVLQRKEVNVGLMSIGIDYFQVVALFAQTKIAWPSELLDFFRVLSIFNLNLELMAPECSFKFGYETKWFWTESVPLIGFAIFLTLHYGKYFHKRCVKNRRNKLHSHIHTMIGTGLVLMYYMYLYITRTTLDIFNCGPTVPDDGHEYMEAVFVKCYEDPLHKLLFPWAIFFFIFYSIGYPCVVGYILYRGRESAKEDQLLRASLTGGTRKTNPNCYDFRKRYHKLYYNFKPQFVWWVMVILLRKFMISIAAIIFRKNPTFQMAVILMVLFGSYAVQVIYRPYMSPSEYKEILENHAAQIGDTESAVFDSSYRKKVRRKVKLGGEQMPTLTSTAKAVGNFFFNYNTVEASLLTSAIFLALAGIMFESGRLDTSRYAGQRAALTAWVVLLIVVSIIYWITVAVTEVIITVRPDLCQKKKSAKEQAAGDGFDMNDSHNPLHNAVGSDDAARAHMGKAQAEAALQRHQAVIEQQSLEILELKKKVQANQLSNNASRRNKKDKTTKKTKKVFSPVRSSSIAGEGEDDFMDDEESGVIEAGTERGRAMSNAANI